jgi:hypothetical protein
MNTTILTADSIAAKVRPALGQKLLTASMAGQESVTVDVAELGNVLSILKREDETQGVIGICTKPRFQGGRANMGVLRAVGHDITRVDDVRKVARFSCGLGVWKNWVDNKAGRETGEKSDYNPLPPKGVEYVGRSPLMRGVKDPDKRYVCVQPTAFHVETEYRMVCQGTPHSYYPASECRVPPS